MSNFSDPSYISWHLDENGEKISIQRSNLNHIVTNGRFILDYIPDKFYKITFSTPSSMIEKKLHEEILLATEYKVDYTSGLVYVHSSLEGSTVTVTYYSRGIILYPSTRIYVDNNTNVTLQDKIDTIESSKSTLDTRVSGHVGGTTEKHTTTHITNSSNVSGSTTTDVLNSINTRLDNHTNGSLEKHGSSNILNQSSQSGTTVSDAINSIAGVVQNITVTNSNANIGVYSLNATGTNTITTTYSGLTLFAGLKIHLTIVNDNTGAVTVNLNSIGAKNVYKVVLNVKTALSSRDLRTGEIAQLQYDGTDFILLNGNRNEEYSTTQVSTNSINTLPSTSQGLVDEMVVKGRTYTNLFTDAVAGCESTSGWGLVNATVSIDSANELEGTNCLKVVVASGVSGQIYIDILPLMTQGKYYMLSCSLKNFDNATNIRLGLNHVGDAGVTYATNATTNYVRVGLLVQPSDFNTATNSYLIIESVGAIGQYGFVDAIALHEISATDYALGVTALLNKYEWHLGTKSCDKMRVLSVGKNLESSFEGGNISGSGLNEVGYETTRIRSAGYRRINPNTTYTISVEGVNITSHTVLWYEYDANFKFLGNQNNMTITGTALKFTTTTGTYIRWVERNLTIYNNAKIQLEQSATATVYEPYQQTQSTCPLPLREVPTITDTWDAVRGKHVKNVSDWVTISGIALTGIFSTSGVGFKNVVLPNMAPNCIPASNKLLIIKYNNRQLNSVYPPLAVDDCATSGTLARIVIDVANSDTGFLEIWDGVTSFIGLTWDGLIKAYFNGWKLTTANVNVASCVWTGIASGTTKTGASGYTDVTTTIDIGFTPYKMLYQLATPITTYLHPNVLLANPNGTIYQENFIEDYGWYNSGLALTDTSKLITNLVEVRKWNLNDGSYTIIPNSSITLTAGVITAITGAVSGEFYTFDYNYDDSLGLNGELNYSYGVNTMAQTKLNSENIITLDNKIESLDKLTKTQSKTSSLALGSISATTSYICFIAPRNCELLSINLATKDAITANNTNYWTISAINKGSDGTGANVIANKNTTITSGLGFLAYDTWSMGSLNNSYNNLVQGDLVLLTFTKTASATSFAEAYAIIEYV